MIRNVGNVADRQRLGMKLELRDETPFASRIKLATSWATRGILPDRRGAGWQWNDKGALRMIFGFRGFRSGILAASLLVAMPAAVTVGAALVSTTAVAQTVASIAV
jgi:outer membrane protein insertion porin family